MPIVPTIQGRQVESRGVQTRGFQTFQQPNMGDVLVNAGGQAIDVFAQEKQRANIALSQEASLQLNQFSSDLMTNPQTGLLRQLGKNAVGKGHEYTQQFDAKTQELASKLSESARAAFMQQAQQQRIQFAGSATRYEIGQINQYESGMQQGTLNAMTQKAISSPEAFNDSAINAYQSIIAYGKAHGQSEQEIEGNWVQWREQAANKASEAWYTPTYMQMMGPDGKIEVTDTPSESQIFSAMIWNESGGNQFDKDGAPLLSSKGAAGVAQVMEDTGPEAARFAGLEWDRDKWLNDPRYNAQLGKAYFGAQMKKYDNNPVLAVAAYNAGPGAVDGWINRFGDPRTGQVSNEQFAAAIPFEETRNYVSKVTGSAGAIPGQATMENLTRQPFWNAMSPQNKSAMMAKVAGMYDMQASAGRISLQSKMGDDIAALEAGKPVTPITAAQWASTFPLQASPAERMQLEKNFHQYQQAMTLQPVYQSIMQGTPQQGMAAVQAMAPRESDYDFKYKQELYATAQAKLNAVLKARESDPGTWLQKNSNVAQSAFQMYQNGQASGEYLVSRLQAEKDRLNIVSKKVLPDTMIDNILTKIDNNNESSVQAIQAVAQSFGKYSDQVMQQVQKSAFPALQVVMATENPRAANALWQNRSVKTSDLRGSFEKSTADSADSSWNDQAKEFAGTMIIQPGGAAVWNNFNEQGKRLTYINMQRGMSESDAAKQAYQDILGSQYQTTDTWRMPNTSGQDLRDVKDGASKYLGDLKPEQIMPLIGDPRLPEVVNREQSISRIRDNGQWVTNSDETGLTLMMNGLLVNGADGKPISVRFSELAKLGVGNRSYWNSLGKDLSKVKTYTPGEAAKESAKRNRHFVEELGRQGKAESTNMADGMRRANANLHQ